MPDLKELLEQLQEHQGWKVYRQGLDNRIKELQDLINGCSSWDQFLETRGRLRELRWIENPMVLFEEEADEKDELKEEDIT